MHAGGRGFESHPLHVCHPAEPRAAASESPVPHPPHRSAEFCVRRPCRRCASFYREHPLSVSLDNPLTAQPIFLMFFAPETLQIGCRSAMPDSDALPSPEPSGTAVALLGAFGASGWRTFGLMVKSPRPAATPRINSYDTNALHIDIDHLRQSYREIAPPRSAAALAVLNGRGPEQ